jgi:hypothetical protein
MDQMGHAPAIHVWELLVVEPARGVSVEVQLQVQGNNTGSMWPVMNPAAPPTCAAQADMTAASQMEA